jgi:hypothetical protein
MTEPFNSPTGEKGLGDSDEEGENKELKEGGLMVFAFAWADILLSVLIFEGLLLAFMGKSQCFPPMQE